MSNQDDPQQHRLANASPRVLQNMLDQAEQELRIHLRAIDNTHHTRARRERSAAKAERCKERIGQIKAEQKHRAEAEHLNLAKRPYETAEQIGDTAYHELLRIEDELTRAELHAIEYHQFAQQAKTDKERADQTMRAEHWKKRAINARSRIEEFILMHQDDVFKPWLEDQDVEPGQLH